MVRKIAPETRLLTAAAELQSFCAGHGWRACVIGGLAAIRWGRPRTTRDVDVSLWTGLGEEWFPNSCLETYLAGQITRGDH